ncbi:hypothetical protein K502DRAFT_165878 [Neoconidiobolus thromboides FSU 785]|nr:hypothetical protein K502DRAFT_165878 [Neoconidiobolus thromboides FSU 785]
MRDLPGFYFDPERNRYFKITQGGPTNISTASSSTTRQYPQYTVNSIKNSKKANKKQKLDILLSRKRQLIIKDKLNIPFNNVSGLQSILWGRRKMDVKINAIGFNELFLKPQMGSMFKKKVSFHGNNLEAKCSLSVGKYVIIGTASGKVKIIKFDNPNIDLEKETKINVQSNTLYSDLSQITSLKLIKNNLA